MNTIATCASSSASNDPKPTNANSWVPNMHEYLISFGLNGDFAPFQSGETLQRGDRVVVKSSRGLELGTVLCESAARSAGMIPGLGGQLVRRATSEDESLAQRLRQRTHQLFEDSRRLAQEQNLPLEVLDVEILLDDRHATLHVLGDGGQPLIEALSAKYGIAITVEDLAIPAPAPDTGCGKPDCGSGHGGCSTCSTGGGCGTGCGSPELSRQTAEYFSQLRQKMEGQPQRTPLL